MRPILYAHRGASAELPENTLPSFARAIELGADALETDAHLTRDGVVVLSHDETGMRMAGVPRAIRDCTWEEVRGWDVGWGFRRGFERPFKNRGYRVPRLEEALVEIPDVVFNVDAKPRDDRMVDALVSVVRSLRAENRVRIASFHAENLRRVRKMGYAGETGLAQSEVIRLVFQPLRLLRRFPVPGNAAQIPVKVGPIRLDSTSFLDKAHALKLRVDYWTIDDPDQAKRLLALGADGIMTDDPARVAPVVRAFRGA